MIWPKIIVLILFGIDMLLTVSYVYKYKEWQPEKPYNQMEKNPLLVWLWNHVGLIEGWVIGVIIIASILLTLFAFTDKWFAFMMIGIYSLVIFNHIKNFWLLHILKGGL